MIEDRGKIAIKNMQKYAQLALLLGAIGLLCFYWQYKFPYSNYRNLYGFGFRFYGLGVCVILSLMTLGSVVRRNLIRSEYYILDLVLGFGLFAFFLNIYVKVTLNLVLPCLILLIFFIWGLRTLYNNRGQILNCFQKRSTVLFILFGGFFIISFSVFPSNTGFLFFPMDFDSGLFHVFFPKMIVAAGHYYIPDNLRAPFIPQLMHSVYIFVLNCFNSNESYLKLINLIVFTQITIIFFFIKIRSLKYLGLIIFCILCISPEFQNIVTSTNLDAGLGLFTSALFAAFLYFLKDRKASSLILIMLMAGFAGGQKHFGLMFSAPILIASVIIYLYYHTVKEKNYKWTFIQAGLISLIFLFVTFSFYIHNLLNGANLLFPFYGSWVNPYGWEIEELKYFTTTCITLWGHSKAVLGYFLIPIHLIQYPAKYGFILTNTPIDFLFSVQMGLLFIFLPISLLFKRLRKLDIWLPIFILLIQIFSWYRGSQVIRYLFPLSITWFILLIHILSNFENLKKFKKSLFYITIIIFAAVSLLLNKGLTQPVTFQVPLVYEEKMSWLNTTFAHKIKPYRWLSEHKNVVNRSLNISPTSWQFLHFIPDLKICGDWFSTFAYGKYMDDYTRFKEWDKLSLELKKKNFSHIVVNWTETNSEIRPKTEEDWNKVFPESTRNCLSIVFSTPESDIFEIKKECLK